MVEKLYHDADKLNDLVATPENRTYLTIANFELFRRLYNGIVNKTPRQIELTPMNAEDLTYYISNYEEIHLRWEEMNPIDKYNLFIVLLAIEQPQTVMNIQNYFSQFMKSMKEIMDYYYKRPSGGREFMTKREEFVTYIGAALLLEQ